jgi:hypothetical protein
MKHDWAGETINNDIQNSIIDEEKRLELYYFYAMMQ